MKLRISKYRFYILRALVMGGFTFLLRQEAYGRFMARYSITEIIPADIFIFRYADTKNIFMLILLLIIGRFFCGWLCPLGLFADIFEKVFGKIRPSFIGFKIKIPYKLDAALFFLPYIFTPILFRYFVAGDNRVVAPFAIVCLLSMFFIHGRVPCKYLCVAGTLPGLLSALSPFKISRENSKCSGCKACSDKCSMAIDERGGTFYKNLYCVRCFECFSVCKEKAVRLKSRISHLIGKNKESEFGN